MAKRVSLKGKGADIFFGEYAPAEAAPAEPAPEPTAEPGPASPAEASAPPNRSGPTAEPRRAGPKTRRDATPDADQLPAPEVGATSPVTEPPPVDTLVSGTPGTMIPRVDDATVESIRRAVRVVGKESATHRITKEERDLLAEIIYTYGRQGIRTSVNEIARIGINYLCRDYQQNGSRSLLDRVLRKLND